MDKLIFGLTVTVIGIAIVFFGLVLLIGLIKLITVVTQPKKKEEPIHAPAPAVSPAPVAVVEDAPVSQDDTLIAVITAAVAAMMEDGSAFVVRRVRHISNTPTWHKAGREEQIYSRF